MTVTISIEDNVDFCVAHDLVEVEENECTCLKLDFPDPDCPFCQGTGTECYKSYPFEMNLANANFSTLWHALGLDFDYCGQLDPEVLLEAVNCTEAALVERCDRHIDQHIISLGIPRERAESYLVDILSMAYEAIQRKKNITWG